MNVSGDGFGGELGDQYIPPEYTALKLPTAIQVFRPLFFGTKPDRLMLNYRCQQLLALLHATELSQFVTDLDPRITYDPDDDTLFQPANFQVQVFPPQDMFIKGPADVPDRWGQCRRSWWLSLENDATMMVHRTSAPRTQLAVPFTVTGNLSTDIPLPGSNLRFSFRPGSANVSIENWRTFLSSQWRKMGSFDWNYLASKTVNEQITNLWRIDETLRPQFQLGDIESSLRQIGEPPILALFGVGSKRAETEPWRTFYNLWLGHPELPYSLGGLVLGIIYATDLVRQGVAL